MSADCHLIDRMSADCHLIDRIIRHLGCSLDDARFYLIEYRQKYLFQNIGTFFAGANSRTIIKPLELSEKEGSKGDKYVIHNTARLGINSFPKRSLAGGQRNDDGVND